MWTRSGQLTILIHRRWLDEKTEQSFDNIKHRGKIALVLVIVIIMVEEYMIRKEKRRMNNGTCKGK